MLACSKASYSMVLCISVVASRKFSPFFSGVPVVTKNLLPTEGGGVAGQTAWRQPSISPKLLFPPCTFVGSASLFKCPLPGVGPTTHISLVRRTLTCNVGRLFSQIVAHFPPSLCTCTYIFQVFIVYKRWRRGGEKKCWCFFLVDTNAPCVVSFIMSVTLCREHSPSHRKIRNRRSTCGGASFSSGVFGFVCAGVSWKLESSRCRRSTHCCSRVATNYRGNHFAVFFLNFFETIRHESACHKVQVCGKTFLHEAE